MRKYLIILCGIVILIGATFPSKHPPKRPLRYPLIQDSSCVLSLNFNENTGTLTRDGSAQGNDGTLTGCTWKDDDSGVYLSFNGSSDYVDCGSDTSLNITNAITISAWVKPRSYSPMNTLFSQIGGGKWLQLFYYSDKFQIAYSISVSPGQGTRHYSEAQPPLNQWSHIIITIDESNNGTVYLNSVSKGTQVLSNFNKPISSPNTKIGWDGVPERQVNGTIDDVRIYNRALSGNEISDMYEKGRWRQ